MYSELHLNFPFFINIFLFLFFQLSFGGTLQEWKKATEGQGDEWNCGA